MEIIASWFCSTVKSQTKCNLPSCQAGKDVKFSHLRKIKIRHIRRFLSTRCVTVMFYLQMTQSEGPHLSLTDAVSRAARSAGVLPVTAPDNLQGELEMLQEDYTTQVEHRRVLDPLHNIATFWKCN